MAEVLLVRSGTADEVVARRHELSIDELERLVGTRALHYLGTELPPIGETSRVSEFSDPDHVVARVTRDETQRLDLVEPGFYAIEDLSPTDVAPATGNAA